MGWIKGYKIPVIGNPKRNVNFKIDKNEKLLIEKEIIKLLNINAISECYYQKDQFLSPFFLRKKPNGDMRFILNLKSLNEYIENDHFKMEDIRTVTRLMGKNYFMTTIDLKDAYFSISIEKSSRKFLRFYFDEKYFEFNCLPFGLSCAPYIFTKILKPVAQYLRERGILVVIYLDDLIIMAKTANLCKKHTNTAKLILENLGFILNIKKCQLDPSSVCKFLGVIIDSKEYSLKLPEEKRKNLIKLIKTFLLKKKSKIRELAQLIGNLTAACPAVNYGWLYTKELERVKFLALQKYNNPYEKIIELPHHIKHDLEWWLKNIKHSFNPIRNSKFDITIYTDASKTGWGAYIENNEKTHGWWSNSESKENINFLELKAIYYALKSLGRNFKNLNILLRVDNTTAISYINRMGGIQFPHLHKIAKMIWQWCEQRKIWIFASYIKSKDNKIADAESRCKSIETEWELNELVFEEIEYEFGPFDIDLFATKNNTKCKRYISWKPDPNAIAIDAFTVSWKKEFFYAFPPFSLILKTIQKIIEDKAEGVLIVPYWKSQPWFPLLMSLISSPILFFGPKYNLLLSPFHSQHPMSSKLILAAVKLSAKHLK